VTIAGPAKNGIKLKANVTRTATIAAPENYSGPLVQVVDADDVEVSRLRIEGPFTGPGGVGCPPDGVAVGVLVTSTSNHAKVLNNVIGNIIEPPTEFCPGFLGVSVSVIFGGRASVGDNDIQEFKNNGIQVSSQESFASIYGNEVIGAALDDPPSQPLQQGITVSDSNADVYNNVVRRVLGPPGTHESIGIHVRGAGPRVNVGGNQVSENDVGFKVTSQTGAVVKNNRAFANNAQGVLVESSLNNLFYRNDFRGNGGLDCEDRTAGSNPSQRGFPKYTTQQRWVNSKGLDAAPTQICTSTGVAGPPVG
jgi:parallel beta-helix repeat protein